MMRREVLLTADAERDLEDLHRWIAEADSTKSAARLLDRLLELAEDLATLPDRSSAPKELQSVGIHEYRQVLLKPWRISYRVVDDQIIIYVIADGRRDMQSLLARRLLGG